MLEAAWVFLVDMCIYEQKQKQKKPQKNNKKQKNKTKVIYRKDRQAEGAKLLDLHVSCQGGSLTPAVW